MQCVLIVGGHADSLVNFRAPVIRALRLRGCRVVAAAPGPISTQDHTRLLELGVEVRTFRMMRTGMNPVADILSSFELWKVIRNVRPDAVLAYTAKPVIYGGLAAWMAGVSYRCAWITGLGYGFTAGGGWRRTLARHVLQCGYRSVLARYHVVLFQNTDDLEVFRKRGLIGSDAHVEITAGSGVDTEWFAPTQLPVAPTFLMAARLLRDKGVYEYVEAAKQIKRQYPQSHFILAGDADSNPAAVEISELAEWQGSGILEHVSWTDDIRSVINRCRIFVLPSYREGMPRSVLEAMAMGRPVISTNAPGCRDAVDDGVTGLLVPVADTEGLARAMERLITIPGLAEEMGRAGRQRAVERFDARRVGEHVARLLCDG
jgi:glycosyltransferase involved in cell wall biosynthesis